MRSNEQERFAAVVARYPLAGTRGRAIKAATRAALNKEIK